MRTVDTPAHSKPAAFRLRQLRVQPTTGLVSGPGGEVHLEPRVMAVLEVLAQHDRQLVTRGELLETIWPGGNIYDEALTQCVYQLRQQLQSAGGGEHYRDMITTVPKRGYILNSEVVFESAVPASPASAGRKWSRGWLAVASLAVVLGVILTWALALRYELPAVEDPTSRIGSLAVLPFLPLVADHGDPVLELGMADTLITRLGGGRNLVVRPMSSVRRYTALDRDALVAGLELGVGTVVDGSVLRSGESLRVSVRLLRVSDGTALWADTFSAPFSDVFSVQDRICARIATALAPELGLELPDVSVRGGTTNTQAYEQYLQGRYHLARLTPEQLRISVEKFRAAVAIDPNYAQAWLGLANVQFRLPIAGEGIPRDYYPRAREAAERALGIDPSLAEGHAMLGWIDHWFAWDWSAAEAHFKRAIELDPNDTESHLGYAHLLSTTGRNRQAVEEVRRARELSPYYMIAAALEGWFLAQDGRLDEGVRRMEEARGSGDNVWLLHANLAIAYFAQGRHGEALEEIRRARRISGGSTWTMVREAEMLAGMGRPADARAVVDELLEIAGRRYVPSYDLAVAYRTIGDLDTALDQLQRGFELRDPKMTFLTDSGWEPLADRPAFQSLLQRMNFPADAK